MIGTKITNHFTFYWWQISWTVITPLLLFVKLVDLRRDY
jgi:ABC-type phosphate/phosphonate transport system permease subunit